MARGFPGGLPDHPFRQKKGKTPLFPFTVVHLRLDLRGLLPPYRAQYARRQARRVWEATTLPGRQLTGACVTRPE
jgi:hypothetical protein